MLSYLELLSTVLLLLTSKSFANPTNGFNWIINAADVILTDIFLSCSY
ncbi:hypothetical protein [Paraclostridium sordellii]|nr:hypothetical protein [Paeniclostridium sordellii]